MSFRLILIAAFTAAATLAAAAPAESEEKEPAAKEPLPPPETLALPMKKKCEGEDKKDPGTACKEPPEPPATPFDTLAFPALDPPDEGEPSDPPDDESETPKKQ